MALSEQELSGLEMAADCAGLHGEFMDLLADLSALRERCREAEEALLEMWHQFAYPNDPKTPGDQGRWTGGLSALEGAEAYLKPRALIDNGGCPQWDKVKDPPARQEDLAAKEPRDGDPK